MKDVFKILEREARTTPEQLSSMTGLPVEQVRELIRQAEKDRAIFGYRTLVNWQKMGEEQVWALVEVKVTPQRDVGFDAVAQHIARFPEVRSLHLVSGDYDLAVIVVGKTLQEVAAFVAHKLATIETVSGTATHFLLKRFKDDGVVLEGEEEAKRLPLVP